MGITLVQHKGARCTCARKEMGCSETPLYLAECMKGSFPDDEFRIVHIKQKLTKKRSGRAAFGKLRRIPALAAFVALCLAAAAARASASI